MLKTLKVAIINARNTVNSNGEPVGHEEKVINEAKKLIIDIAKDEQVSTKNLRYNTIDVPFADIYEKQCSLRLKLLKDFYNTLIAFCKSRKFDILWFVIITEAVFWAIFLFPKCKKRLIITSYLDYANLYEKNIKLKRLRKYIYNKACRKVDIYIVTNKNFERCPNQIFLPDYYLDNSLEKYRHVQKQNIIACIGQMRETRDLVGVIETFKNTRYSVDIVGQFVNEAFYQEIKNLSTENIIIENRLLNYDEYYSLIARAKYIILPYKMQDYKGRTSGVLLETVFLGAIPIAPRELLEYNGINGIGYDNISDIPNIIKEYNISGFKNNLEEYEYEKVKKKFKDKLNGII